VSRRAAARPPSIHKFGGASLRDARALGAALAIVQKAERPAVVVVSAFAGVTDALLGLAGDLARGNDAAVRKTAAELRGRYEAAARSVARPGEECVLWDLDQRVGVEEPWGIDSTRVAEIQAARRVDARLVAHTGCVWGSAMTGGVKEMHAHGLLGPEQVHVHCNTLDETDWLRLAHAGAKVSISPETELNMGMGRLAFDACARHGIKPTLSCDVVSLNSGDLFAQMRLGLAYERFRRNDVVNQAGGMPARLAPTARDALAWATVNGADACGIESLTGSLRPGKQADVIVVGGGSLASGPRVDPAGSIVFQGSARDVRTVLVAGRIVKRDGALVGVDLARTLATAEASAERVLARVREITPVLPPRGVPVDFDALARMNLAGAGGA